MQLRVLNKLKSLSSRDRRLVRKFLADGKLRDKVVKEMQARGFGLGIMPDNIDEWLALIMKWLPVFIVIILKFV